MCVEPLIAPILLALTHYTPLAAVFPIIRMYNQSLRFGLVLAILVQNIILSEPNRFSFRIQYSRY